MYSQQFYQQWFSSAFFFNNTVINIAKANYWLFIATGKYFYREGVG